ncbi:hypothetical protein QZH41_016301, partial [Actinostola sp. cb2023]
KTSIILPRDKKKHFMSNTLIVTPDGMIVHCSAAFPGHLNDINCFNMMPTRIGPGCDLALPQGCHIMADLGYHPTQSLSGQRKGIRSEGMQGCNL